MIINRIFNRRSAFPFFQTKRARFFHLLNLFIFTALFLIIYNPFGVITAEREGGLALVFMSAAMAFVLTFVSTITMLLSYKLISKNKFMIYHFMLMIILNLSISAIFYVADDFTIYTYLRTIVFLLGVMLVPYSLTILLSIIGFLGRELFLKHKESQILIDREDLTNTDLIPFIDEYGNIEFYLYKDSLLYIEANDNYVNIYSWNNEKITCNILRSSMKNIESQLSPLGIIRCHRSYVVNTKKIVFAKKERSKMFLELVNCDFLVPVSSSFAPEIDKYLHS